MQKSASRGSTEYLVILFDHYLVITRVRLEGASLYYVVQRPVCKCRFMEMLESACQSSRTLHMANMDVPFSIIADPGRMAHGDS